MSETRDEQESSPQLEPHTPPITAQAAPNPQSDSSDSDSDVVQESHRNIGSSSGETQPLLNKKKRKTRTKGRNRLLHPEDYEATEDYTPNDDDYLDAEFYANNGRFQVHKNYIVVLSNWKAILNVVLFINTLLLVMIFVSEFVIEILPTDRIASFNNFILILVSLIGNCFNLWFNKIGLFSPFDLHLNVVLTVLPMLHLLVLFSIKFTRDRINKVTILMFLWTSFTFSLGILQAHNLRKYIRNLSPPTAQNKHSLTEWIEIAFRNVVKFISLVLLVLLLLADILHAIDISNALKHSKKENSMFVWANPEHTKRLHISCYGVKTNISDVSVDSSQPVVLFEHGGEDTSYTSGRWIEELYNLGKIDKYCVYDRFGFGLSDSDSAPISLKKSAESLRHALVEELQITDKFIAVGYDYGALVSRVFAADNRDICNGLLLLDGWNEELLLKHYLRRIFPGEGNGGGNDDDGHGDTKIDYKVPEREIGKRYTIQTWIYGVWSAFGLNLQSSWLISHHGSLTRIFGEDMTEEGQFIRNKVLEALTSSLSSYNDILASNIKIQDIPLSVVSSKQFIKISPVWGNWQRKLTKLSSKTLEWRIIEGGHKFYKNGIAVEQAQDVLLRMINE
ncbi:hypothetical protein DAKH74_005190 [Maudiozyma humilis]|uniref:AB hydrolase-1 domain-containing protein n=1 Tax=Maudiozyma humilis TaxID=51915 RepID=A0AAV5RRN3_MAUHU|nr:hypothetical protein DAKH74_005190 [Kazachstania humilis]